MAQEIVVHNNNVVEVFTGIQHEYGDVIISNSATIHLTGVSFGGTIENVEVPCKIFYTSMVPGRNFVKGQITEIPEIYLDSSIKIGVKLYSCSNNLINATSFTSAKFTFDDVLEFPANIDPVSNLIYIIAVPEDLILLSGNKIYDMRLHVVDRSGNPSVVLKQKIRFV